MVVSQNATFFPTTKTEPTLTLAEQYFSSVNNNDVALACSFMPERQKTLLRAQGTSCEKERGTELNELHAQGYTVTVRQELEFNEEGEHISFVIVEQGTKEEKEKVWYLLQFDSEGKVVAVE